MLGERRLVVAAGLAAALPIVVSTLHAVTVDWVPLGDNAYTAVRAFDVFTDRSPLVGQWSSGASTAAGELTYSPGPLLFWLLAIPARLPAESLMVVTMGLVNVACVVGAMALARRRGGWPLMLALAAALPLMLASLPGDAYSNIWNSSAALMPFTLLVFLCWSLACGEYRLLPLTVVVASLVAQTHLTFVGPAVGVTLVGLVGLALSRRAPRRWVLGSLAVALVCWSAPLIDQATNDPGNLRLLVRAATTDVPTLGSSAGWKAVVHMAGIPPWWLQDERNPLERLGDLTARPSALAIGSTLLVLAGLGAITIIGWRRRRPEVWAAGALGLVLCLAVGANAATTPTDAAPTVGYTLRWASPAGMFVWLGLAWSAVTLGAPAALAERSRPRLAAPAGAAAVLAIAVVVAARADFAPEPYGEVGLIADRLDAELPEGRPTRLAVSSTPATFYMASNVQSGIAYALRRGGWDISAPAIAPGLGPDYAGGAFDQVVHVDVDKPPTAGSRLLVRVEARQPFDLDTSERVINVSLARAGGGR